MQVTTKTLPNDIFFEQARYFLQNGQTVTLAVRGISMRPFFEPGRDEIKVASCENITRGDVIIALTSTGSYVAHRVIGITDDNITLMGDGNLRETELVRRSDVIGKVVAYRRKGRGEFLPLRGIKWRIYSYFWMHTRPLRLYLLAGYRRLFLKMW